MSVIKIHYKLALWCHLGVFLEKANSWHFNLTNIEWYWHTNLAHHMQTERQNRISWLVVKCVSEPYTVWAHTRQCFVSDYRMCNFKYPNYGDSANLSKLRQCRCLQCTVIVQSSVPFWSVIWHSAVSVDTQAMPMFLQFKPDSDQELFSLSIILPNLCIKPLFATESMNH